MVVILLFFILIVRGVFHSSIPMWALLNVSLGSNHVEKVFGY